MKKVLVVLAIFSFVACKKKDTPGPSLAPLNMSNVSYGTDDAKQNMDIYLPGGRTDTTKMLVLVHGGSWVSGDKSDFGSTVTALQQKFPAYAIANINYRLATATTNHFPTQENDMKAAVDYLIQKSADYHVSKNIILLGASAGAQMALLQAYKYSTPHIKAVVDFFGPTDMADLYSFYQPGSDSWLGIQVLMNGDPVTNPTLYYQSSPINFVTTLAPPTLILHGTADDVVPVSQSQTLKEKLDNAGVANQLLLYPDQGHDVWSPVVMNDALNKIQAFLFSSGR